MGQGVELYMSPTLKQRTNIENPLDKSSSPIEDMTLPQIPELDLETLYFQQSSKPHDSYKEIVTFERAQARNSRKDSFTWHASGNWEDHLAAIFSKGDYDSIAFFRNHIEDGLLLDCGGALGTGMLNFAKRLGAKAYLNVDRILIPGATSSPHINLARSVYPDYRGNMKIAAVQADILEVLALLPSQSCSISINSVGSGMIVSQYWYRAVAQEMQRVLRSNAIILSTNYGAVDHLSQDLFEAVPAEKWGGDNFTEEFEKMRVFTLSRK